MAYKVELKPAAIRDLKKLNQKTKIRITKTIDALSENPLPSGVKKLQGSDHFFRIRVGDYRILYQIEGKKLIIIIIRIKHRRDIYKQLFFKSSQ